MEQRGRTSIAALEVANHSAVAQMKRCEPPMELGPEERHEWLKVVEDLPSDWFRASNVAVLEAYCRAVVNGRRLTEMLSEMLGSHDFDLRSYERLLKLQDAQHRTVTMMATKMRLTQQSMVDPERRKEQKRARKPWE
jgi:hypothetical protein